MDSESDSEEYIQNTLITISYSLIVIVSLVGNTLVFKTIAFQPKMRNSTNMLIAVLAVSDLLMTTFNIPFTVVDIILTDWIFGQFFCTSVAFVQANCVYVSSFTMAVIAINRWRAVYKTRPQQSNRSDNKLSAHFIILLLMIWLLAALHALPHTIFNVIRVYPGNIRRCITQLPDSEYNLRIILTLVTFVTQYLIPLSCAGIIYTRIAFTILSQGRVGEATEDRARQITSKKRRRIAMLILVVTIFALCWLPFNIYYFLLDFGVIKRANYYIFLFCHWLAMSSVCYK
ncbi:unnamed protein product [Medioppia subpectinata]|uniref:G-protein coupled receptors family 1 profile domain-containing protein n=1 Tax=Medioppia subpectinata TaxID=1979941 RepID=A0A7R9L045_9ACAR|nr:unnamed protein product [Medioppia subpectinata]CAG2111834.1 unnamed protein product [Medioppia subpectinata]